jgi:hypothetical protein
MKKGQAYANFCGDYIVLDVRGGYLVVLYTSGIRAWQEEELLSSTTRRDWAELRRRANGDTGQQHGSAPMGLLH